MQRRWVGLEKAAEQGNASAQYNLGLMYDNGRVFQKMMQRRRAGLEKQPSRGNASAQYNLGFMYDNGLGVSTRRCRGGGMVSQGC